MILFIFYKCKKYFYDIKFSKISLRILNRINFGRFWQLVKKKIFKFLK